MRLSLRTWVEILFAGDYYIFNRGCLGSLLVFLVGHLVVLEVDMLSLFFNGCWAEYGGFHISAGSLTHSIVRYRMY